MFKNIKFNIKIINGEAIENLNIIIFNKIEGDLVEYKKLCLEIIKKIQKHEIPLNEKALMNLKKNSSSVSSINKEEDGSKT